MITPAEDDRRPGPRQSRDRERAERRPLAFPPDNEDQWHRLARGYRVAGLLIGSHRLGLLRLLADGRPRETGELADEVIAERGLLLSICRALRAAGLLHAVDGGWTLSDAGRRLASDADASLELDAMADDYRRWGELDRHARELTRDDHDDPRSDDDRAVADNAQAARRYARRLSNRRRQQVRRLLDRVEPIRDLAVLDAWGGDGYLARDLVRRWPRCTCTVLEIPTMASVARDACAGHPRIAVVTADLLTDDPAAALGGETVDLVVLSHVLQSLSQQRRRELTAQIVRVVAPGGCVLSSEYVLRWNDEDSLDVLLWAVGRRASHWQGDALRATEQDLLLRGTGLAATGSWWVTDATRAVLAVKPAAGIAPALRLLPQQTAPAG